MIYVLYEIDGASKEHVLGVYNSEEALAAAKKRIATEWTEDCFAVDPKESGLIREYDYDRIYKECCDTLKVATFAGFNG